MATNVPMFQCPDRHSVYVAGATGANLCLVPDSTADRAAKVPATDARVTQFIGVTFAAIAAGGYGDVAASSGDVAVIKASGTVTKGDRVYLDTATGKEGRVKTYTNFPLLGTKFIVGVALTTASDGNLCEVRLEPCVIGDGFATGTATLVAGVATVANTLVKATSKIQVTVNTPGAATAGARKVVKDADITADTSFVIRAVDLTSGGGAVTSDIDTVNWLMTF